MAEKEVKTLTVILITIPINLCNIPTPSQSHGSRASSDSVARNVSETLLILQRFLEFCKTKRAHSMKTGSKGQRTSQP